MIPVVDKNGVMVYVIVCSGEFYFFALGYIDLKIFYDIKEKK